jgi:excisionase family DNA binding protein
VTSSRWLSIAEVARELGVSADTAMRRVKTGSIPGGERMYAHGRGERWHVSREAFTAWRAAMRERPTG